MQNHVDNKTSKIYTIKPLAGPSIKKSKGAMKNEM